MNDIDRWNDRFDTDTYVFGEAPNRFLVEQADRLAPDSKVLAVADGEGRNGVWLAEMGHRIVSVDASHTGQAKARALAARRGVSIELMVADLLDWDWPDGAYDAVVAIFIQFAGPSGRAAMLAGMMRATRPGGVILLQGYRPEQLAYGTGGPPVAENMYTEAMLRQAFAGWEVEHLAIHDSVIEEGPGHSGMSALIDLVARRPE
ncbi:SAM-dependent methyltransferase [Sphingomonas aestuarii]